MTNIFNLCTAYDLSLAMRSDPCDLIHHVMQYVPVSVGSGFICGWGARSGSWVDAFGFVFLQPVSALVAVWDSLLS